jgi:excinuclease UvrABC ATPase subunit
MRTINYLYLLCLIATGLLITSLYDPSYHPQGEFKYVGVTTCVGACHKSEAQGKQYNIWKETKHSKAFLSLQTAVADSIAKERGFTTTAAETPQCVKCHVLGKEILESEFTETFNKTDGVQCETCHGPGSEYKKLSIMKDRQKSIENGLIIHTEKESFCTGCHNSESPTFVSFNYDEMWPKIAHPKPKE